MKPRSLIFMLLIVLLPLLLLTWAGVRMARDEQTLVEQRFRGVMAVRLQDVNRLLQQYFQEVERNLLRITAVDDFTVTQLRARLRAEPQVLQLFVLNAQGELQHPDPRAALNSTERSFLLRTAGMFAGRELTSVIAQQEQAGPTTGTQETRSLSGTAGSQRTSSSQASSGWFVWYWDRGLNLIYWQKRPSGHVVGAALERARWTADLIAKLPDTQDASRDSGDVTHVPTRIQLLDAASELVYQWGEIPSGDGELVPIAEVACPPPLGSWRLQCAVPDRRLMTGTGRGAWLGLTGGMFAACTAVAGLGWLLYRDYARDMREAAQQVSFVNQVSHELKTPLTNIRMYAELLEADLELLNPSDVKRPTQRLRVITEEAGRLSRLIGNVLTFAQQQRQALQPQCRPVCLAELIPQIVDRFTPSLSQHGITVDVDVQPAPVVSLDPDFLEQILVNLISNVEKYAATGERLVIRGSVLPTPQMAVIDVIDHGPGISGQRRQEIFRPFSRLRHDVSSAAGTGIGLSITRGLARLHGGDVTLEPSASGCHFRVTIRCSDAG